jgi:hypothetical protein
VRVRVLCVVCVYWSASGRRSLSRSLALLYFAALASKLVNSTMSQRPEVDEVEAALQLIRMFQLFARGRTQMEPITIKAVKRLKALVGLKSGATRQGKMYWKVPEDIGIHLQRIGIDPQTGVCVDRKAFELALFELEQEKANKLAAQDAQANKEALRKAMEAYSPPKPSQTMTPGQVLANAGLITSVAKRLEAARLAELDGEDRPIERKRFGRTLIRPEIPGPSYENLDDWG